MAPQKNWKDWRPFVFGGLASCVAECGTFPIDTTKTRLQVQGQKSCNVHRNLKYRGMIHALYTIGREEGLHVLYSGLAPAVLRQATYGTIKIGIYHMLKRMLIRDPEGPPVQFYISEETFQMDVFCAVIAGTVSSAIANPTDVLKVRMQTRSAEFKSLSMLSAFRKIYQTEGVKGLWRGVGPTSQRAAVVVGVELPAYDICKKHLISDFNMKDNTTTHFTASFIAGLCGAIASTPIDVVKTRLMNQQKLKTALVGAQAPVLYAGSIDCIIQTVKHEGPLALYKGFIPSWLRLGPWNIIFFMTYEQIKNIV